MTDESIFTHHTAALDDVRLHYVTAGTGEPIVRLDEDLAASPENLAGRR